MIDIRKGESRLVYKLFKTWRWKVIPREKKSTIKSKCEAVQNYSVTGNLEKMYKNRLTSFLSDFQVIFHRPLLFDVIF